MFYQLRTQCPVFTTWSLTLNHSVQKVYLLTNPQTVPVHRPLEPPTGHHRNAGILWTQTGLGAEPQLCGQSPPPNETSKHRNIKKKLVNAFLFIVRKFIILIPNDKPQSAVHATWWPEIHTHLPYVWAVGPRQFCLPPLGDSCQWAAQTFLQGLHGNDSQSQPSGLRKSIEERGVEEDEQQCVKTDFFYRNLLIADKNINSIVWARGFQNRALWAPSDKITITVYKNISKNMCIMPVTQMMPFRQCVLIFSCHQALPQHFD